MSISDLIGNEVVERSGSKVAVADFSGPDKVVGLYFSAHWCPPCRGFTPKLAEFYNIMKNAGKQFEVVFLSSDRDQKSFDEYFKEMPWLAVPFGDRKMKDKLSNKYGVRGIPTLIILDGQTGEIMVQDGRGMVAKDPEGKSFPWRQ